MFLDSIRLPVARRERRLMCRARVSEAASLLRMRLLTKTGVRSFGMRSLTAMRLCLWRSFFLCFPFFVLAFVLFILVGGILLS
jgi:hypothetical protein